MRELTQGEIAKIKEWCFKYGGGKDKELGGFVLDKGLTFEDAVDGIESKSSEEFFSYYPDRVVGFWHSHPGEFTYTLTRADFEFSEDTKWAILLYHPKSDTWDWHDPKDQFRGHGMRKSPYFNFFHPRKGVLACRNCGLEQVCLVDIFEQEVYKPWIDSLNDILRAKEVRRNADRVAAQKFLNLAQRCPPGILQQKLIEEGLKINKTLNPSKNNYFGGFQ